MSAPRGPKWLLLTTFGLGFMRPASGTWGSMPPPAIAVGLVLLLGQDGLISGVDHGVINGVLVVLAIIFSVACIVGGRDAEELFGSKDPSQVVADETAGQSIALLALPWTAVTNGGELVRTLSIAATAFIAFRVLDIIKPPPARQFEKFPAGTGILADDLMCGVYALITTQLVARMLI